MPFADRVIVGRIATLAGGRGFGWAEALAITGGRVIAAGRWSEVEPLVGAATRLWRLGPQLAVVPGITDAHLHLATAALAASQLDVSAASRREEVLQTVRLAHRERAARGDATGWLLGHGWSLDRMGGWPTAADLDAAVPGRPVALWAHDHHARWLSRTALTAAGIGPGTPAPRGGEIRRDSAGAVTGILHENASTLVDAAIPSPSAEELEKAVARYATRLLALGVTGVHDPGELTDDPDATAGPWLYRAMAERGALPLRVVASIRERQMARAAAWGLRSGRSLGRYRDGWLKLFSDGSLGSRSAGLLEPYEEDDPGGPPVGGSCGMLLHTPEELAASSGAASRAGIAVQVHAIGDAAVRGALTVLAGLSRPAGEVHHRIEHAQLVHPQDVPRFAALGIAASVQPCHLGTDAEPMVAAWGDRAAHSFALLSLHATGALIPLGTDAPVESPDPWRNLAAAVGRRDPAWARQRASFHTEQALPTWRALRAACRDPALSSGATDEGRLTPGSRADFVVIPAAGLTDDDPTAAALAVTRPLATAIDGQVVFRDQGFHLEA